MHESTDVKCPKGIGVITKSGKDFILRELDRLMEAKIRYLQEACSSQNLREVRIIKKRLGIKSVTYTWHTPENWDWDENVHTDIFLSPRFAAFLDSLECVQVPDAEDPDFDPMFDSVHWNYFLPDGRILRISERFRLEIIGK
jgi:hypothetical protein